MLRVSLLSNFLPHSILFPVQRCSPLFPLVPTCSPPFPFREHTPFQPLLHNFLKPVPPCFDSVLGRVHARREPRRDFTRSRRDTLGCKHGELQPGQRQQYRNYVAGGGWRRPYSERPGSLSTAAAGERGSDSDPESGSPSTLLLCRRSADSGHRSGATQSTRRGNTRGLRNGIYGMSSGRALFWFDVCRPNDPPPLFGVAGQKRSKLSGGTRR